MLRTKWFALLLLLVCLFLVLPEAAAHRDNCHRWHACPSDSGSYVCGDTGHCENCPDNAYCLDGKSRQEDAPPELSCSHLALISRVVDGDTLLIRLGELQFKKVRLYGIDAPEKAQDYGAAATAFVTGMALHSPAIVQVHDTDRYGRLVVDVILASGHNLSHELVRNGFAWWYRQYAPDDETLERLEQDARAAKRGLWAEESPTAPWDWRRQN